MARGARMKIYIVIFTSSESKEICATFKRKENAAAYVELQNKLFGHFNTYSYECWHVLDTDYVKDSE
jgi:hypothetical protein